MPNPSLDEQLIKIGLKANAAKLFERRRQYSRARLEELQRRLKTLPPLKDYPQLTVYAAGSYARGEASQHSDIDLFFIHDDSVKVDDPHLKSIRVMSGILQEIEEGLEFPPPSNDGQFLNIIWLSKILTHLGGPEDDHQNHFTARLLLLLESAPVFGTKTYNAAIDKIIEAYLRDYQDHAENFRPTFLVNDILRFWKTLCLNYEHRRNQEDQARKIKQKIRNFKLSYSRLMTCFATIALLSSYNTMTKAQLVPLCKMDPIQRLLALQKRIPKITQKLITALEEYHWFLEKTELSAQRLEKYFSDKNNRIEAFAHSKRFGDAMYEIVAITAQSTGNLRYLVI